MSVPLFSLNLTFPHFRRKQVNCDSNCARACFWSGGVWGGGYPNSPQANVTPPHNVSRGPQIATRFKEETFTKERHDAPSTIQEITAVWQYNNTTVSTTVQLSIQQYNCQYNSTTVSTTIQLSVQQCNCQYNSTTVSTTVQLSVQQCNCQYNSTTVSTTIQLSVQQCSCRYNSTALIKLQSI
jgi:hypothetical protein